MVDAKLGVDISQATNSSIWECLRDSGYEFAIVRASRSNGLLDDNAPNSIKLAKAAGMSRVDAYIFPCVKCGNPAGQMKSMMKFLNDHGANIRMVWLDIEGPEYWNKNVVDNRNFFLGLVRTGKQMGLMMGIYTSASQWNPIMGANFHGGSHLPLWYAHYDNRPSFYDFVEFGGWKQPYVKQYNTGVLCDIQVDENFRIK
ncbi:hypothetical protein PPL_01755 [Heterostelium album PN500]|uniref:lysozyme n=1 Tax=Heterostelium pallidum (strain ATCC 26659 / Pp 5 / PN500) TaxID=670386 RepID=D3B0D9_HETP5|nr:hypothetical protein PPL_01755 [Heterostelium album PN500]EFA84763.1 hypothetical protein PPL_01755 [Heterostelium album PN500]|eukprot:XP_020436875.1 hypothetical protein PPL_01755 [Heterostelium album PN500]